MKDAIPVVVKTPKKKEREEEKDQHKARNTRLLIFDLWLL